MISKLIFKRESPAVIDDTMAQEPSDSVEAALRVLLDKSQASLGFPVDPRPRESPDVNKPTTLEYEFSGTISVRLKTSWEIISGLKLEQVRLTVEVGGYGGTNRARTEGEFVATNSATFFIFIFIFILF